MVMRRAWLFVTAWVLAGVACCAAQDTPDELLPSIEEITWEQALNSRQKLVPDELNWQTKLDEMPLSLPGLTKLI